MSEHLSPIAKQDCIDTWRKAGRISLPARTGNIIDVHIVAMYECTAVNGRPLDLLIEAQTKRNEPVKRFGVIFSKNQPDRSEYAIPILWRQEGKSELGIWT